MKGVHRSAIAIIPLTAASSLLWIPLSQASPIHRSPFTIAQVESTTTPLPQAGLAAGTEIPVIVPGGNPEANLVMAVGESFDTSFEVAQDIVDEANNVILPKGSTISGSFEPETIKRREGARFKANRVTIGNQSYRLQATSDPFVAKRRNQISANDVSSSVSTIAAATVVDSLFNRVGRSAGIDRRIIRGAKRGAGVGVLPTVLKTGQKLTQKANSQDEVIVVTPTELGLKLDTQFQGLSTTETQQATSAGVPTVVNSGVTLASGRRLRLKANTPGTRYIVDTEESFPVEFQVAKDVFNQDAVIIPKGSIVKGTLTPSRSGSIFKASQLVSAGQTYELDAQTAVIAPTDVSSLDPSSLTGNTVTSPQASSTLAKVKSGESSSGGGLLGGLLGSQKPTQVIIFDPTAQPLRLFSDLIFTSQS